MKFSQRIDSEEDPKKDCVNYPTMIFKDFDECDKTHIRKEIKQDLNITPFWIAESLNDVTNYRYSISLIKIALNIKLIYAITQ